MAASRAPGDKSIRIFLRSQGGSRGRGSAVAARVSGRGLAITGGGFVIVTATDSSIDGRLPSIAATDSSAGGSLVSITATDSSTDGRQGGKWRSNRNRGLATAPKGRSNGHFRTAQGTETERIVRS